MKIVNYQKFDTLLAAFRHYDKASNGGELFGNAWAYRSQQFDVDQGSANYSLWAKSGPLFVCISKVLLEHNHACVVFSIVYGCFCTMNAELGSSNKNCMAFKT